jgi:hypothetical protein
LQYYSQLLNPDTILNDLAHNFTVGRTKRPFLTGQEARGRGKRNNAYNGEQNILPPNCAPKPIILSFQNTILF